MNKRAQSLSVSKQPSLPAWAAGGILRRKCDCGNHAGAGATCEACERQKPNLLRRATGQAPAGAVPPIARDVLSSPGRPLDSATRTFMESRLGHDLSRVRVHTDARAAAAARAVNALAYTVGHNVVFASGQYAPGTAGGNRILAHELVHVLQAGAASPARALTIGAADTRFEREADHIADQVAAGEKTPLAITRSPHAAAMLHRKLPCSLKHLDDECNNAAAACLAVASECSSRFPTPKAIDDQYDKATKEAKDKAAKYPNASVNLLHFLGNSGAEKVMPVAAFEKHPETLKRLLEHRQKFLDGARKRLESGALAPGGTVEMVWTGTANAFTSADDLAIAVGGYTLCSNVRVKADAAGGDNYTISFLDWTVQAFDCYNWDPGKGIGVVGFDDTAQCCLENAGKAKHFRIRTDEWKNMDAASTASGAVTAKLPAPAASGGSATPPPSTTTPPESSKSPGIGERIRKALFGR